MKKNIWTRVIAMSLMMILLLPGQAVLGATTSFKFDQEKVVAKTNEPFSVNLKGEAITDLYGFEVALSYDASQIEIVGKPSVKFTEGFSAGPTRASDSKVYFGFTKIGKKPGDKGNINLGEFKFKAKKPGTHTIKLESIKVVDSKMSSKDFKVGQTITVVADGIAKADLLTDIKGHWAEKCIREIVNAEYMVGKTETLFKPNDKLTRGEMATILSRIVEVTEAGQNTFKDIKGDEWYAANIIKMANKEILKGYEDNTFKPKHNITRAETMVVLARIEKEKGTYIAPVDVNKTLSVYKDASKVPAWAKEEVAWAVEKGLIKGDEKGNINMKNNITRAETAVILCRLLELEEH